MRSAADDELAAVWAAAPKAADGGASGVGGEAMLVSDFQI